MAATPVDAVQIIPGPGDGASLVLTTPSTSTTLTVDAPFLPIVAAANSLPRLLLGSGPGASSYRLDAVPFSSPLLTGGFDGGSRFVASLLPQLSMASLVKPAALAPGSAPAAVGGRSPVAPAGGDRGIGIDTPIGRVAISSHGYQFGRWRYPLASVRGIATTLLISLGALAAITALLGGVSAGAAILRRRRADSGFRPIRNRPPQPVPEEDWDF